MKFRKASLIIVCILLISLLIPTGAAFAVAEDPGGGGDNGGDPPVIKVPRDPKPNKVSSSGTNPPWCVSKLCFNPSYFFGGEITLEQDGKNVKISITGTVFTSGQLSFPLPEGADPYKCTFYKDGVAQPNTVFKGNDGNVYTIIGQPPGSISGTWSIQCDS
ncbi:MAG: hypothetical protein H8D37_02930 [Chloroflexi bacterium]|nr:hypothetical protein [Chloroflexota bacterium]